jgi:hypothetical protein
MAACPRLIAHEDFDLWRYPSMPHILKMCNNRPSIASSTHQRLPASKTPHPQLCQPAEAVCHMLSHHFRETTLSLNWIRHSPWIPSTTRAACTMIEWSAQELNNRGKGAPLPPPPPCTSLAKKGLLLIVDRMIGFKFEVPLELLNGIPNWDPRAGTSIEWRLGILCGWDQPIIHLPSNIVLKYI